MKKNRRLRRVLLEAGSIWKLALPIVAGMVSQTLMGLVDTLMVGRVGVVPLAACSFINAVSHLPFVFAIGLMTAIPVLTSQAYGAKRFEEVGESMRHGLALATLAGLATAFVLIGLKPFLGYFGQDPAVVQEAGPYLIYFALSLVPALIGHACKQVAEAVNAPWVPNIILLSAVGLNAFLNWIFIYGNLGAPEMGLEGAGLATFLARLIMCLALILYLYKGRQLQGFQPPQWLARLSLARMTAFVRLGAPAGIQHLLEVSAFAFSALMMGWISADAIAAHQVALSCAATTFMFALGIGMAVCIRIGHAWGAGNFERVRRLGISGIVMGVAAMGLFGILFAIGNEMIAGWFVKAPELIQLTASLLVVAAFFQVVDGLQVVAISALRGVSDVRIPAMVAALAYWLVAVPVGYSLGFWTRLGPVGIWTGLAIGLGVAAVCLTWRFFLHTKPSRIESSVRNTAPRGVGAIH